LYLAITPLGGYAFLMSEPHVHASHPAIATRLKRADGHLRRVIGMIEEGRPCVDLATQLHAVERAVAEAKRALIHDHIDHCVTAAGDHDLAEIKALTKLL
jgi:DNA-binding FrmR family transcriptional regulator